MLTRRTLVTGATACAAVWINGVSRARAAIVPPEANAALPYAEQYLGCAVAGDDVANTQFWDFHSHRFTAEKTGQVSKARWWQISHPTNTGYSRGDGGVVRLELRPGNDSGLPAATVLAQTPDYAGPISLGQWPLMTFLAPAQVQEGQTYHLVYRQLNSARGSVSVNDLYSQTAIAPLTAWPCWDNLASLRWTGSAWQVRPGFTPLFELHYQDGAIKGQGYGFGGKYDVRAIGGTDKARQRVVPDRSVTIGNMTARLWRLSSGAGNLDVQIKTSTGGILAQATIARASIPLKTDPNGWVNIPLTMPVQLTAATTYYVEMSALKGANYQIQGTWRASGFGMAEDKLSSRNRAEYTTGAAWTGLSLWGKSDRSDLDFPLLLTVAGGLQTCS